jgi:hypothetical protein
MNHLVVAFLIIVTLAVLWVFYDKFTKRGAIPIAKAAREFTTWWGLAGIAAADYFLQLLRWVADFWDPLQTTIGPALSAPGMDKVVMIWSAVMLALKFKGQAPRLQLPDLPASPASGQGG